MPISSAQGAVLLNTINVFGFTLPQIIGLVGVAFYLGSYAALQTGLIRGSGYLYAFLNAIAATLVLISLFQDFNLTSAIIQIFWITISIVGMARLYYVRNRIRLSPAEQEFLSLKLPDLENDTADRIFKAGEWLELEKGTMIMKETKPIEHLYYLESGQAIASLKGKKIALISPQNYIGEITCFTGDPASATVKLSENSNVFRIPVSNLRKIAPTNSSLRQMIEGSIAHDLRAKLVIKNNAAAKGTR